MYMYVFNKFNSNLQYNCFGLLVTIRDYINMDIKIINNNEIIILKYQDKKCEFSLDFFDFYYPTQRRSITEELFNEYKNLVIKKLLNEQVITNDNITKSIAENNITFPKLQNGEQIKRTKSIAENKITLPIETKIQTIKLNIKTLLQKILKDDKNFKVLKNSQKENKARIQNTETAEIIEIKPSEFGFEKGIRENKNLNESEIKEYKEKLSKLLSKNTINEKINKFNIKTLLQEILKNDNDFKVLKKF